MRVHEPNMFPTDPMSLWGQRIQMIDRAGFHLRETSKRCAVRLKNIVPYHCDTDSAPSNQVEPLKNMP